MKLRNIVSIFSSLFLGCLLSSSNLNCPSEDEDTTYPQKYDVRLFGGWHKSDTSDIFGPSYKIIYFGYGTGNLENNSNNCYDMEWYIDCDSTIIYRRKIPDEEPTKEEPYWTKHNFGGDCQCEYDYINDTTIFLTYITKSPTSNINVIADTVTYSRNMPSAADRVFYGEWIVDSVITPGNGHLFDYYNFCFNYNDFVNTRYGVRHVNMLVDSTIANNGIIYLWKRPSCLVVEGYTSRGIDYDVLEDFYYEMSFNFIDINYLELSLYKYSKDLSGTAPEIKRYKRTR